VELAGRPADRPRPNPTIARCHAYDSAATKIKSLNLACVRNGVQSGGNLIAKSLKITYLDAPAPCTSRSYSAKYYWVNPQG
jgi:hypothetical protein